jgi:thiol:disulfide interchange protein DsbC
MNTVIARLGRAFAGAALAASLLVAAPAHAQGDAAPPQIKAAVESWLQGRFKVENVRRSPVAGIWEVQIGTDLIYVDDKAEHGFVEGQLIDLRSSKNLTQTRIDELTAIPFKDLPFSKAFKQVIGKGTRQLAVFEDPNCGHCRNLRRDLLTMTDVTIYTFTLPILTADSEEKSRQAWCAKDKVKAWNDLMLHGKVPDNKGTCDNPVKEIAELGRKLRINGTPTIFFANGKRVPGGVPGDQLRKLIDENSKPT